MAQKYESFHAGKFANIFRNAKTGGGKQEEEPKTKPMFLFLFLLLKIARGDFVPRAGSDSYLNEPAIRIETKGLSQKQKKAAYAALVHPIGEGSNFFEDFYSILSLGRIGCALD